LARLASEGGFWNGTRSREVRKGELQSLNLTSYSAGVQKIYGVIAELAL